MSDAPVQSCDDTARKVFKRCKHLAAVWAAGWYRRQRSTPAIQSSENKLLTHTQQQQDMSSPPRERKRLVLAPRSAEGAAKAASDRQASAKVVSWLRDAQTTVARWRLVPIAGTDIV